LALATIWEVSTPLGGSISAKMANSPAANLRFNCILFLRFAIFKPVPDI
jgi:hypothetical protein